MSTKKQLISAIQKKVQLKQFFVMLNDPQLLQSVCSSVASRPKTVHIGKNMFTANKLLANYQTFKKLNLRLIALEHADFFPFVSQVEKKASHLIVLVGYKQHTFLKDQVNSLSTDHLISQFHTGLSEYKKFYFLLKKLSNS